MKPTEEEVFQQYVKAAGHTEPIGLAVPIGYPSGIENSEDIVKSYQECIKKGISWEELLDFKNPKYVDI